MHPVSDVTALPAGEMRSPRPFLQTQSPPVQASGMAEGWSCGSDAGRFKDMRCTCGKGYNTCNMIYNQKASKWLPKSKRRCSIVGELDFHDVLEKGLVDFSTSFLVGVASECREWADIHLW